MTPDPKSIAATMAAAAMQNLKIDEEFKDLLPPLSADAMKELRASIEAEGIRDPLIVWAGEDVLVDGHNRYHIAKEKNIIPAVVEREFKDRAHVIRWILQNQLGRRNLTPDERTYFIGRLYNEVKQSDKTPMEGGKTTAQVIAEQHGVSERTVRRAGDIAKGIDRIAQVKGAIAKQQELSGKSEYTDEERAEIGKTSNPAVAKRALDKLDQIKSQTKAATNAKKAAQKAISKMPTLYRAAFIQPNFTHNYKAADEPRPPLEKEAIVFFVTPDEHLPDTFELIERWGLEYNGQIVYCGDDKYEGVFTKIEHCSLVIATRGVVAGPKKGKEPASCQTVKGDPVEAMVKVADTLIGDGKKIDMRHKGGPANGWDGPAK